MNINEWLTFAGTISSAIVFLVTLGWSFAWWMSRQFSATRHLVDTKIDQLEKSIVEKLEYHERHDDKRFSELKNDVWDIRVRNAARDGLNPLSSRERDAP